MKTENNQKANLQVFLKFILFYGNNSYLFIYTSDFWPFFLANQSGIQWIKCIFNKIKTIKIDKNLQQIQ